MLRQRLITAAFGIPVIVAGVWFGSWWFTGLIIIAGGVGIWEFYSMARASKREPLTYFGIVWGILFIISPHFPSINTVPILMTGAVVIPLVWLLVRRSRETAFSNLGWTVIGILYMGWLISYWVQLRLLTEVDGRAWVFWGMAVVFASDTTAYFIGRWKGKHKMAPSISPKKTWEGAAGGLGGSMIASVAVGVFIWPLLGWPEAVLLGAIGSVLAQVGDLTGSLLKRNFGVKDSGPSFLPGHGGFVDRMCSLFLVGVFMYYGVQGYLGRLF